MELSTTATGLQHPKLDAKAAAEQLALFIRPGQFTELRAVGRTDGQIHSGWYDSEHLPDMIRAARGLHRQCSRVQFIPNPIRPEVAARRLNTVLNVQKGFALSRDSDVEARQFLIVDIDPKRPKVAGQEVPSSDQELDAARQVARMGIIPYLTEHGFPEPVEMLSGNGVHLVYRVRNRPITRFDPAAELLEHLAAKFDSAAVTIDTNTYNSARMLKVPGTLSQKGNATTDRPHRVAGVVHVPADWPAGDQAADLDAFMDRVKPGWNDAPPVRPRGEVRDHREEDKVRRAIASLVG